MSAYYNESELLTLHELCDEFKISESLAYKLLTEGSIKGIKIGRIWRIPKSSIQEYIKNCLTAI